MTTKEQDERVLDEWRSRLHALRAVRDNGEHASPELRAKLKEIDDCAELARKARWCRERLLDELVVLVRSGR